jgi:hypothetical protein
VRAGSILAEDLRLTSGVLLAPRGYEVTATLVERLRNATPGTIREPVRVRVRDP